MRLLAFLFLAGGAGSSFRYLTATGMTYLLGAPPQWATLLVNAVGCLLIGMLNHLSLRSGLIQSDVAMVITTGFLGGLTTFSAFGYETYLLLERRAFFLAGANMLGSLALALACVWLGSWLGGALASN